MFIFLVQKNIVYQLSLVFTNASKLWTTNAGETPELTGMTWTVEEDIWGHAKCAIPGLAAHCSIMRTMQWFDWLPDCPEPL